MRDASPQEGLVWQLQSYGKVPCLAKAADINREKKQIRQTKMTDIRMAWQTQKINSS